MSKRTDAMEQVLQDMEDYNNAIEEQYTMPEIVEMGRLFDDFVKKADELIERVDKS